jgi:hypothetical protein
MECGRRGIASGAPDPIDGRLGYPSFGTRQSFDLGSLFIREERTPDIRHDT